MSKRRSKNADTLPAAGDIFSFQTSPYSEFSPKHTARYAAFKILGSGKDLIIVAVLEGIWTTRPRYSEASASAILKEQRFATGRLAVFGLSSEGWSVDELKETTLLGTAQLSDDEKKLAEQIASHQPGSSYSFLRSASIDAEGEWRWRHDREALAAEIEMIKARNDAELAAREERYRNRLQSLTWEKLLAETPFAKWSPSPPYPPEDFIAVARDMIRNACVELQTLGQKPGKAAVRAVLKRCVTWFNEADARLGGVIETEEREDICATLEEMAFVARQRGLIDEIDAWREW